MDLRLLVYFLAVAEELHFGRAAERLHIAQPALSIQIKHLEQRLGGALLLRSKRNVQLTEAGKLLVQEAQKILHQVALSEGLVRRALKGELGTLELGYSAGVALSGLLASLLGRLRAEQPAIRIQLHEMTAPEQISGLLHGQLHAGLLSGVSLQLPDALDCIKLSTWPLCVVLPETHPLACKECVRSEDLRNEVFILYTGVRDEEKFGIFEQILGVPPRVAQKTGNPVIMASLVGAGLGIALLPSLHKRFFAPAGVVFRPLVDVHLALECMLAFRRDGEEPMVRILEDFCADGSLSTF